MRPTGRDSCLVVVDVQYDFMPGGALAVVKGDEVVPVINALLPRFENVVLTQDWHPRGHASFASAHAGKKAFETTRLAYGDQVLWPDHCVQGTKGAEIHAGLQATKAQLVIRKGFHEGIDSYSGFVEADRRTSTGLDFCVAWTALDARTAGFETTLIDDASRAIDLNGSLAQAWKDLAAAGVHRKASAAV
jgi:nicotinamidase/pyrazinamidase